MNKQIINKVLIALAFSTITAPVFANPTIDAAAIRVNNFIDQHNTRWPWTALVIGREIPLAILGGAIVGGTATFAVNKLAQYFGGKNKHSASFAYGAIGGAVTALATVPIAYLMLKYGTELGMGIILNSTPN